MILLANIWDNYRRLNKIILGDRAWSKRLRYDFINFSKEWLSDFLAGLIDGDGTVFTNTSTCCRIYTTSYYLVHQLYAICMKLGLKFNVCKAQYSEKYDRTRLSFNCDIRFYNSDIQINSEKIKNNGEIVPIKIRKEKVIRGFDKITTIREIEKWDYPVYDIKTESEEFLLSCVQTHNTFHTGGAAKIKSRDALTDMINNDPHLDRDILSKLLIQKDSDLIVLKDGKLTLELEDYDVADDLLIDEESGTIWLKSLLGVYETTNGEKINLILDFSCEIYTPSGLTKEGKDRIIINYKENDRFMTVPMETENIKELVLYLKRLIGGKEIFRDTTHLLMKLYKIYGPISDMDLVHLEVLLSQCLRDKDRPILPARIGKNPHDPIMFNIKKNVFNTSFLQGLAFENVGEAIRTGLTSQFELEPSVLEKVLLGTLVPLPEEKAKK